MLIQGHSQYRPPIDVHAHGPGASLSDLVRCLDPADGLPYGRLNLSNMLVVRIPLPRPEKAPETIPAPPGNHMHVDVRDALADPVVDGDERAVRVQARFNRSGQGLDVCEQETSRDLTGNAATPVLIGGGMFLAVIFCVVMCRLLQTKVETAHSSV